MHILLLSASVKVLLGLEVDCVEWPDWVTDSGAPNVGWFGAAIAGDGRNEACEEATPDGCGGIIVWPQCGRPR